MPVILIPLMPNWALIETHPTQGRAFQRPLDAGERAFFWDGCFNGTADTLNHVELRLPNVSRDAHLYSEANIIQAWLSTKRLFPLVGVTVQLLPVSLHLLHSPTLPCKNMISLSCVRRRFIFGQVACAEEMSQRIAAIWDGPRPLSNELLARLYFFRETDSQRADILHLMMLIAHCVTDAMREQDFDAGFLGHLCEEGGPRQDAARGKVGNGGTLIGAWTCASVFAQSSKTALEIGYRRRFTSIQGSETGRTYSTMSPHPYDTARSCAARPRLYHVYSGTDQYGDQ